MSESKIRRYKPRDIHGIVLLDKPEGMTSNAALQTVKRLFGAKKGGHTGSLDPLASGMLPLCFGDATKVSGFLLDAPPLAARNAGRASALAMTCAKQGSVPTLAHGHRMPPS